MKITLENTDKLVELKIKGVRVPARIWEGTTASGIPVHCYITRIAIKEGLDPTEFEKELLEQRPVSAELAAAIPSRLVL